jgi:hypothetical protein
MSAQIGRSDEAVVETSSIEPSPPDFQRRWRPGGSILRGYMVTIALSTLTVP